MEKIGADEVNETYRSCPDQRNAVCEAWDLLEKGTSFEAGKLLHEYDKDNKISLMDPLMGTVYLHVGLALMNKYARTPNRNGFKLRCLNQHQHDRDGFC